MTMRHILALLVVPLLIATAGASRPVAGSAILLEGYVIDASTGRPLEGVLIGVRSGVQIIRMTSLKTDLQGHFAVHVIDSRVAMSFFCRGYEGLGYSLATVSQEPLRIELRPALPVRGTLVDLVGAPHAKTRIRLVPTQPGGLQRVLQAVTDADGWYEIDGAVESMNYMMEVERPGCGRQSLRTATGRVLSAGGAVVDIVLPCR